MLNIEKIRDSILRLNPWYQNSDFLFPEESFRKRQQYTRAESYLSKELMITLIGLRRTGKTTILRQLINSILKQNNNPNQILLYEFDEENTDLEGVLDFYWKNVYKISLHEAQCYIFLDELQFVNNWQVVLKRYHDLNSQIHFIISGSTHLFLHENTKESLTGRLVDIQIDPLSWYEFLNFKYKKDYSIIDYIWENNFVEKAQEQSDILLYASDFDSYLKYGEFPYYFHEVNAFELDRYYQDAILDKIFSRDIHLFDIDNHQSFRQLFRLLSKDTGSEINLQNISREIELSSVTIKRYIDILQKMFLYGYLEKYEKSVRKQIKSFKKGYALSLNLLQASLNIQFSALAKSQQGHLIETFVYNEMLKAGNPMINYYHDTKLKKEVDFVLQKWLQVLPIEVKLAATVKPKDVSNLLFFMNKNNLKRGLLVYGGVEAQRQHIDGLQIDLVPFVML